MQPHRRSAVQQPLRYVAALIALHQGDLTRARGAVATGIGDDSEEWTSRYAWPVVWLAMRTEADDATRYRDRREDVPAAITARCAELAGVAAWLAAAEHARAAGTATAADWAAAVAAWRAAEEPYPLSYALLRLAEAHVTAGETAEAEAAVNEAHARAPLGAAPVADEAAALARRARLNLAPADGQASGNAGQPIPDRRPTSSPGSGSPIASARCCCSSPPGAPTRRSPGRCSSARRRRACTCPTSSPSWASAAGSRRPPSCTGSDSAAKGGGRGSKGPGRQPADAGPALSRIVEV